MSAPVIPVEITIDGKTYVEQMEVSMDGLAAAIVERALKFTDANDRGDEASRLLEDFEDATEKARLFALCRLLAAAKATGSAT